MLLSLAACCAAEQTSVSVQPQENAIDKAAQPENVIYPERIVSGYYISTSVLIALGLKDRIVGVEAKADKRPIYALSAPELMGLPSTGTAKSFDLEGCIAMEPDLVILPKKLKDQAESLEDLGVSVLIVNPESEEAQIKMIRDIAEATGTMERAGKLIDFISESKAELKKMVEPEYMPRVYMTGNSDYLTTCGPAMYQASLIEAAGGINVADNIKDNYWAEVSYEQLLAWDPEYIILAAESEYSVDDIMQDTSLAGCTAVINGDVYKMPGNAEAWDSPVPSSILGMVWLASVLHSDVVTEGYRNSLASEFYKKFYGFEYQF